MWLPTYSEEAFKNMKDDPSTGKRYYQHLNVDLTSSFAIKLEASMVLSLVGATAKD